MRHDGSEMVALNGEEPPIAQRDLLSAQSAPVSRGSAFAQDALSSSTVEELLHLALVQGDQDAWAGIEQCLGKTVRRWLHSHPHKEVACCWESEEHYVARAFERLRQATIQGQMACDRLSGVLVYLRASLNGAILETLRVCRRPRSVSIPWSDGEDCPDRSVVWDQLQALLSNERERRLAYLLYHCGLEPSEIVRCCPQEWSDVQEIARLRHTILERLLNQANLLRSWLNDWEPL
jgi:hypothetical protein